MSLASANRDLPEMIGQSQALLTMGEHVSRIARIDRPVLVVGERGTGKELVGARLHYLSHRWDAPFIKVNCAALTDTLLDSELFGHEAGAFTGATRRHPGRFERAHGGTLFLDEIALASPAVQEKLLRVVEYGEIERLGDTRTRQVDVRVVAATNVDLRAAVQQGDFRADLLDRLAFEAVVVPPLRHRREDIPVLADHFGRAMAHELDVTPFQGFTDAASNALLDYGWPGNIRELRNTAQRSVARWHPRRGPIAEIIFDPLATADDAPGPADGSRIPDASGPGELVHFPQPAEATEVPQAAYDHVAHMTAIETRLVEAALDRHRHHLGRTARHLGLSYDQLRRLIRRLGLDRKTD